MDIDTAIVSPGEDIVLSMEHITKTYGNGFVANRDITFRAKRGECHGLVGENGAGKTTLMKVLFGQETPDSGVIRVNGQTVQIRSPHEALNYGIGLVHQHFMLVESMSVAENMLLGAEPTKGASFDLKKAAELTKKISEEYNLPIDPYAKVKDLSVGYKQRVELLKMLLRGVKILLLDEPTAVLTPQETDELFIQLSQLRELGFTIIFISHKLAEIKRICDRITVLRRGKVVDSCDIDSVSETDISRMMVGRDVFLNIEKQKARPGAEVLRVKDLTYLNRFGVKALDNVSLSVRSGQIVGVAGVEGSGQSELSELLIGLVPLQMGEISICGRTTAGRSIKDIREEGVSFIHEDRMVWGVSGNQTVAENMVAERIDDAHYHQGPFIRDAVINDEAKNHIESFTIACDGPGASVKTLSGGNIQKVVAAREYSSMPKLLVASQLTRGIDVGATELIRNKLIQLRDENKTGVLMFSADLNEILTVSDSIIVLYSGRVAAWFPDAQTVNEKMLGEYMLGIKQMSEVELKGAVYDAAE